MSIVPGSIQASIAQVAQVGELAGRGRDRYRVVENEASMPEVQRKLVDGVELSDAVQATTDSRSEQFRRNGRRPLDKGDPPTVRSVDVTT